NAKVRVVDTINLASRGEGGEFADRLSSAAPNVEDCVLLFYRDMRKPPVSHLGMSRVHISHNQSAEPSRGLPALRYGFVLLYGAVFHRFPPSICPHSQAHPPHKFSESS